MNSLLSRLLLLSFFIFSTLSFHAQDKNKLWQSVASPVNSNFSTVYITEGNNSFLVGSNIFKFSNNKWTPFTYSPLLPVKEIFFINENNIWICSDDSYHFSLLFHFNGKEWKQIHHPLANNISSLYFFEDGTGFITSLGELAYFDGKKWSLLEVSSHYPLRSIIALSRNEFFLLDISKGLMYYKNGNWNLMNPSQSLVNYQSPKTKIIYFIIENNLYYFNGNFLQKLSSNELLSQVSRFVILEDGTFWGVGQKGLILRYRNNKWDRIESPSVEDFHTIDINNNIGWIAGSNGTILKYVPEGTIQDSVSKFGFTSYAFSNYDVTNEYGVALRDFNSDQMIDIYGVALNENNRLHIQKSDSNSQHTLWEEAANRRATGIIGDNENYTLFELDLGIAASDIDNDGDQDIYLTFLDGKNKLLINNGEGYFKVHVNSESRAGGSIKDRSNSAVFGDLNNDGNLDLVVTNEYSSNRIYLNDGNGYFKEVSKDIGLKNIQGGTGCALGDIDNDGDLDLYIANWSRTNTLYRNDLSPDGKITLVDISTASGTSGERFTKSNGCIFADIDNDADLDLFVTNRKTSNRLYRNEGNCKFIDITENSVGIDSMLSYGASFGDFDNDGDLDLCISNVGENAFYVNDGMGNFKDETDLFGLGMSGYSTGLAVADFENDGDLDIYVSNYIGGTSKFFKNLINNHKYIVIDVKGTISNRDAIGAKVYLFKSNSDFDMDSLLSFREVNNSSAYASVSFESVHFGLPSEGTYDVMVEFPMSGIKKYKKNIPNGSKIEIIEEEGFNYTKTNVIKSVLRFITDIESQKQIFKLILVIILLTFSSYIGNKTYNWHYRIHILSYAIILSLYFLLNHLLSDNSTIISDVTPIFSSFILITIFNLIYEKLIFEKKLLVEKEKTRQKIARDLHDDMASTLSSAVIYTSALRQSINDKRSKELKLSNKIEELLLEAQDSMTDIIWSVSPQNDSLNNLVVRIKILFQEICKTNKVTFLSEINTNDENIFVKDDVRRNIYLIFKEAINNIIKHSSATKVKFSASIENNFLVLSLMDNGKGFMINSKKDSTENLKMMGGNGLNNMQNRSKEIDGKLEISSAEDEGTEIRFLIKMSKLGH